MRVFLSLVLSFVLCAAVGAQEIEVARAKAMASLALLKIPHASVEKAKAVEALKECILSREEHTGCLDDLQVAATVADAEKKALFVWVGMTCDVDVRNAFPDAVHCHVAELAGNATPRLNFGKGKTRWLLSKSELGKQAIPIIRKTLDPPPVQPVIQQPVIRAPISSGCESGSCAVPSRIFRR